MTKDVFVSGCFDMLHSGHIAFFREAASYGKLHVALGSDQTCYDLKGRPPVNDEQERLFMVEAVSYVDDVFISQGSGILDFEPELREMQPDLLIVNEDGNIPAKRKLCKELGVEYVVLKREPYAGLPPRSSTALRALERMPYRIDLAGGWLDQPFVSKYYPGPVVTVSIEPTVTFNERSGMATSTRNKALELWGTSLPVDDPEKLAKVLFCYDNPPGTDYISGSQDSIGIVIPGLNKAQYEGEYWPTHIDKLRDERAYQFVEQALTLVPLGPRGPEYDVLSDTRIDQAGARRLAEAANLCWDAICARDVQGFGASMRAGFEAQVAMFPHMMNDTLAEQIDLYRDRALGWKVSGAGGGGYLILVADEPVDGGFHIVVRRGF